MSQTTIKLLHEAEGHVVTIETKSNETYRGYLIDASDTMNCQLMEVTLTTPAGGTQKMKQVFLRGSKIRFMILPEILRNAPMLQQGVATGTGAVPPQSVRGGGRGFGSRTDVEEDAGGQGARGRGGGRNDRGSDRPYKRRRFNH
mmetsp:Transcript_10025/g.37424  ORF Transcript_10025/g.37424 Transcript_10025/m.37424 type:complete len:144 (-) Transcript_10025:162-593(-)